MPDADRAAPELDRRVADIVPDDADLRPIAEALAGRRDHILAEWLLAASAQPFHADHPDRAVADHIPMLLDAVVDVLMRSARRDDVVAPMDDPAVSEAATAHARVRFEQGLGPVAVATEFRLLRQEISRGLATALGQASTIDVIAGQAVIDDALDGAATIGLRSLSERIEALREEFLATTLHDIRQPITLVTGSLDLAARWLHGPEPDAVRIAEVVDNAVVAVGEVNLMLDTLGDASRIAMGALEPDPEPVRLEEVVESSLALLESDGRARVIVGPGAERSIGLWDPALLRRVVVNLVSNALKYSTAPAPVELSIVRGERIVDLEIRDHGMGLRPEEIDRIFDRFARSDRVRAAGIPGLGLGLYATRGIVTAHGGTIAVRSEGVGLGTTVTVRLPLLTDEELDDA